MRRLAASVVMVSLALLHQAQGQAGVTLRRPDLQRRINPALLDGARIVRGGVTDTLKASETVRPGDVVVVPTREPAKSDSSAATGGERHVDLPVRLLTVDRTGTQVLTLTIRVAHEGEGLVFSSATKDFSGDVLIGIEDSLRPTEKLFLGRPMELQLTSDAGRVEPPTIQVAHTNIPWQRVRLTARSPGDTVHITVRAVFSPAGYAAPVAVDRPRIDVRPASASVQGLGLESVPVAVTLPVILRGETVTVTLSSDRGGLDAPTLHIPPSGTADISLRSSGVGRNTVHAEVFGIAAGEAPIRYTFPWPFLIAALLGGVLGTVIRRRQRHLARADFVTGSVAGLVSAVAYAIGLNLTGVDLSVRVGEAAVLVVATLGAALDLPGLARLRDRITADHPRTS